MAARRRRITMSRAQGSVLILVGLVLALFVFVPEVPLLGFAATAANTTLGWIGREPARP